VERPGKNGNNEIMINPGQSTSKDSEKIIRTDGEYNIKVSVRQLVEFILRSGDIDNRRGGSPENAMMEGSRLHRIIQKKMGENYYPEVLLKYKYDTGRFIIEIEGRADGIINEGKHLDKKGDTPLELMGLTPSLNQHLTNEDYDEVTIDEIKCVARDLEYINEPVPVHLAQAKVYAYIYAYQHKLPMIRVRMSYCNIETEEMKYFGYQYSFGEISEWFEEIMSQYIRWADFQYDWHFKSIESIGGLNFPFEYREGQKQLAVYVYKTLKDAKKIYIQAPTGVGKTITTIFPTVKAVGEGMISKIFYLTAKTITRTVAEDTYEILRRGGLLFKTVTITAKDKICYLEKAECNPAACERAKGHLDRVNDALYELITEYDRMDRAAIEAVADKYNVCPFELSLDASLFADGIICDYNYVFDPHASLKRYFGDGMKGEYAFLIDEAHNLVERGRDMFSATLYKEDFLALKRELSAALETQTVKKTFKKPSLSLRLEKALERCNKEMLSLKKECDGCKVLLDIDRLAGLVESLHTVMDQFLEDENENDVRKSVLEFYFEVCHFLMIYEKLDEHYVIYSEHQEDGRFFVKMFCVNPRTNLMEAMSKGKSSILFSATFLPIQYYKNLLGGENTDYEVYAKSTFDNSKMGIYIARDVTSKYTRRNETEFYRIATYIYEIISRRKGNYMVFFPSHSFLASVYEQFSNNFLDAGYMDCILQEEYMNEEMREAFLSFFSNNSQAGNERTLIGFCVLGGIFSEGIDLKNDSLIGAIIVGTGIPMVCNEREILKDYFDDDSASGFDYAYRFPGMNKVLQAAGRVIRTAEDVGIVALLDDRFQFSNNQKLFPREWSDLGYVESTSVGKAVDEFWKKHK